MVQGADYDIKYTVIKMNLIVLLDSKLCLTEVNLVTKFNSTLQNCILSYCCKSIVEITCPLRLGGVKMLD